MASTMRAGSTMQDQARRGCSSSQLRKEQQAQFADPGLANDGDDLELALLDDSLERLLESL